MAVAVLGGRDAIVRMVMADAVIVRVRCCHGGCGRKLPEAVGEQAGIQRREKRHRWEASKISEIVG